MDVPTRLNNLGLRLPDAAAPAANYLPYVASGGLLHVSGQLPFENGAVAVTGIVGREVALEEAQHAAQLCALNILAQAGAAVEGDWRRVARLIKLGGFVASDPGFTAQPQVINGASNLMVEAMGDAGQHARFAVGVAALPLNAAVEIEALFALA